MFQAFLKYLGLDEDTKIAREAARTNFERAEHELAQIQKRLATTSEASSSGTAELSRALRDSEFTLGNRRRAARTGV